MIPEDGQLQNLADEQGASIEALHALLAALRAQAGADQFYVFWLVGKGGEPPRARRQRTLLAFLTPDAALAFAQRNQLADASTQARLRRLSLLQLVQAILREPAITALLFVADQEAPPPAAGLLPHGVRVERADLLRRLRPHIPI